MLPPKLLIIIALAAGFILAALGGRIILPLLRRAHTGQEVREEGPKSHYVKSGTPTFGGLIFLLPFFLIGIIYLIYRFDIRLLLMLLFILVHAAIGFADDYIKVRVNKEGLSPKQKTYLLLIAEAVFIILFLYLPKEPVQLILPFGWGKIAVSGAWRILYGLFLLFYFYACSNAVNITDGIDGLASSVTIIVLIFIGSTALLDYQDIVDEQTALLAFSLAGALGGFLIYNWHKAKVFMGDFGSLALGAAVSLFFFTESVPWAFVLSGFIYVAEILSVFIQVQYFRHTGGKRIFRMSPIHHHYELGGWSEVRIVAVFSLITVLGSVLAGLTFWPWIGS